VNVVLCETLVLVIYLPKMHVIFIRWHVFFFVFDHSRSKIFGFEYCYTVIHLLQPDTVPLVLYLKTTKNRVSIHYDQFLSIFNLTNNGTGG